MSQTRPSVGAFDIAPRTGHYEYGGDWVASMGRPAHIYVFAWHPVCDAETADHRDPSQWQFYVVPTAALPEKQKTISLSVLRRTREPIPVDLLRRAVENEGSRLSLSEGPPIRSLPERTL